MYSRYTSCKRVPKKRTKIRQTQVKRQGSSETSRIKLEIVKTSQIKLEIVETSRIKLETVETSRKNWKLIKHLAFQTEKTHRRERPQQLVAQIRGKGNITKGKKKEEIRSEENSDTTITTSQTNHATSDSSYIEIHTKQAFQQIGCNQVNWS